MVEVPAVGLGDLLPARARRTIAAAVSRTGSASTNSGTTTLIAIACLARHR